MRSCCQPPAPHLARQPVFAQSFLQMRRCVAKPWLDNGNETLSTMLAGCPGKCLLAQHPGNNLVSPCQPHVVRRTSTPRHSCSITRCAAAADKPQLVYLAATQLEGLGRVKDMLQSLGRSMPDVLALHTMTVVEEQCAEHPGQVGWGSK